MNQEKTSKEVVMSRKQLIIAILILTFFSSFVGTTFGLLAKSLTSPSISSHSIHEELEFFSSSLHIILSNYVTDVELNQLIESAVNGMLEELDPYSVYIDSAEYARLRENTSGAFGGLGIEIGIRGEWLTIIAPIENTPAERAGLISGDQIQAIDGVSTEGITVEEAVQKLRGTPGTDVTITILHPGHQDTKEITITREIISIHSVPFSGIIEGTNIGYIRLSNFYSSAGEEVLNALDSLMNEGADKFILDLRNNPGGLLREAIEVSNNFLPKGATIVSTNGRTGKNRFWSDREPICPDSPLIILINFSSASASEIVAGAIQDHDRGLLIGSRSYGKGSVQSIFPLNYGNRGAIKLTTSRYYTPSGRLIDVGHTRTKLEIEEHVEIADTGPFTTIGHLRREVYGGGGINPDFFYYSSLLSPVETSILTEGLYFSFARDYILENPDLPFSFLLPDNVIDSFFEIAFNQGIEREDSISEEALYRITSQLKIAIANAAFGSRGRYIQTLKNDKEVALAVKLLELSSSSSDLFLVSDEHLDWQIIDSVTIAYEDSIREIF